MKLVHSPPNVRITNRARAEGHLGFAHASAIAERFLWDVMIGPDVAISIVGNAAKVRDVISRQLSVSAFDAPIGAD